VAWSAPVAGARACCLRMSPSVQSQSPTVKTYQTSHPTIKGGATWEALPSSRALGDRVAPLSYPLAAG
jgi:hypothetical protein